MRLLRLIPISLLVLGTVHAASITHNSSANFATAPSVLSYLSDIPLFDPAGGILLLVDMEFSGDYDGDFTFTTTSDTDRTIAVAATGL